MKKKKLLLEEAVLDDLAGGPGGFDALEQPVSRSTFRLVAVAVALIVIVVMGRMFWFGEVRGEYFEARALINSGKVTPISSERGIIFDHNGKPLIENVPISKLSINLVELLRDANERDRIIRAVSVIIGMPTEELQNIINNVDLNHQDGIALVKKLTDEEIVKLKALRSPAIRLQEDFERNYFDAQTMAHIIGYTGAVTKDELKLDPTLLLKDIIGKGGLESYYDEYLRGVDGKTLNYRNAVGEIIDTKLLALPVEGANLYTTIDRELQAYFMERMQAKLESIGSRAGAGIVINAQTGAVLAMVSLPTFDSNKISSQALNDPGKPFFNRAVTGMYTPGSTIKPLVATAALEEGVVTPDISVYSEGFLAFANPFNPDQPTTFRDWKAHGWVDLHKALAVSSNVYFYLVGGGTPNDSNARFRGTSQVQGIGIEKLREYWKKFGFGERTNIDLPNERVGLLPDPETKRWLIGDTFNVSIGQGNLLVTPIQLISMIAAMGNGGKVYQPYIVEKIVAKDGTVVRENKPWEKRDNALAMGDSLREVQQGMRDVVAKPYGTAYLLSDLPMPVAAKTGTAQVSQKTKINALFTGFAPAQNPEIAVLVLIEDAAEENLNAVPVAKEVFQWYYENRMISN